MRKSVGAGVVLLLAGGSLWAQQYLISTVAGGGGLPITPAAAVSVTFPRPAAVAVDAAGNAYFSSANFVFKLDASGLLTTVAGTGKAGYSGDGGQAPSARLNFPQGVAVDSAGNVYIADTLNNVVRKVATTGVISTVAGNRSAGFAGDGGPATQAQLNSPQGVAVDSLGNLYIADTSNCMIRKVAGTTITTIAGGTNPGIPHPGNAGDGGPASAALLNYPQGLAADAAGNVFIADTGNNVVREIVALDATITTVAGTGTPGNSGDGQTATAADLNQPFGVAVRSGNLYIADTSNSVVRMVASNGTITTVAGTGDQGYSGDGGAPTSARLNSPAGVAVDASGNIYIADTVNCRIRKVANGAITTAAGAGLWGYAGDGGPATQAELFRPGGVAIDHSGNLYIADTFNYVVRKVTPNGTITTVAGNGTWGNSIAGGQATGVSLGTSYGVAVDGSGNLYIADSDNSAIREVTNGIMTTVAGTGVAGYSGDGVNATQSQLNQPNGVTVDASGNLYIVDTGNNRIRKVTNGIIATVAGNGTSGYTGDGGPATLAEISIPYGVAVDSAGDVYIADGYNAVIRKVTNNTITTVAGGTATSAKLGWPTGVAVDSAGSLYISDYNYFTVRKLVNGNLTTVAGTGAAGYAGDGGPALQAEFESPLAVALDSAGNVYVADDFNNVVRLLVPAETRALVSITSTHSGSFPPGSNGATYSVVVSNAVGAGPTSGTVTVTEIVPAGLTLVSMAGTDWNCSGNTCTRGDALAAASSYPPITVTVNVAADAPALVWNEVAVSGGGAAAASARDLTRIGALAPAAPVLVSPANGANGIGDTTVLTWNAANGAASYDVYFGTISPPPLVTNTAATSYATATLTPGTTYYWQIVAQSGTGSASSAIWSFTTRTALATPLRFVAVTPCRVADTRWGPGPFGGPAVQGGSTRSFAIPQSSCGIPSTAQAYSLNVTVVPNGYLGYLTVWAAGEPQPEVSTLNSWRGIVVANAAIVPAGEGGAVSVYATQATEVILDINGYFDTSTGPDAYSFYPAAPCRIADTRRSADTFGGPEMFPDQTRDFPIPLSSCNIPATARAYSMNVTVVPDGYLGYLTTWPTGVAQPNVSTLNSWTGRVVANAALVPAGSNGSISVFVTQATNLVLDTNGYFAAPGSQGALSFYPMTPCRVADTRRDPGPFGGPILGTNETRTFPMPASSCYVPPGAAAYSVNVTVVPSGYLGYLTAWPAGVEQPNVSTLNSWDGAVVANAAIVPAGAGGAISVFVTQPTHVIIDINGYFAP